MKPMASHQSNKNFAFINQFPDIWIIIGKSQNFHGKGTAKIMISLIENTTEEIREVVIEME